MYLVFILCKSNRTVVYNAGVRGLADRHLNISAIKSTSRDSKTNAIKVKVHLIGVFYAKEVNRFYLRTCKPRQTYFRLAIDAAMSQDRGLCKNDRWPVNFDTDDWIMEDGIPIYCGSFYESWRQVEMEHIWAGMICYIMFGLQLHP